MQGLVRCSFFQYYIYGGGNMDPSPETAGGLLDALGVEGLRVNCACHTAVISVTAKALHDAPKVIDTGWDVVAEADVISTGDLVVIRGELLGTVNELGSLAAAGAGRYRVRCHARNRREASRYQILTEPVEEQLLLSWPVNTSQPMRTLVAEEL